MYFTLTRLLFSAAQTATDGPYWLLTEVIFPMLTTGVGALVGGYLTYLAAKRNFSLDRENSGKQSVELIRMRARRICDKIDKLSSHINELHVCTDDHKSRNFLETAEKLITVLDEVLTAFIFDWEKSEETVYLCSTKTVCKENQKREKYATVFELCNDVLLDIMKCQNLLKEYTKIYKEKTGAKNVSDAKYLAFLSSNECREKLDYAKTILNTLFKKSTEITQILA